MSDANEPLSVGRRLSECAARLGQAVVVRSVRRTNDYEEITWTELDRQSGRVAEKLLQKGVDEDPATVLLLTRNAVEHAVYAYGAWKAGQTVLCLPPHLGSEEGRAILARLGRTISTGANVDWDSGEKLEWSDDGQWPASLEDRVPNPMLLVATGGSTGVPKLVDVLGAGRFVPGAFLGGLNVALKREPGARSFIMTPLSHGAGAATAYMALFEECEVTSLEKFDAEIALWAIETFGLQQITTVPTMMHRMLASPGFRSGRLDSVRSLVHTGGHIDPSAKEAWIDAIGPEKVIEVWGSSESVGHAVISGDEWLQHRGSVGRPINCSVRIVNEEGEDLAVGEIGEIFVKPSMQEVDAANKYFGSSARMKALGDYVSFGDLGYLDADGYLYIAGRTDDLIITGGANVYPDEVEIPIRRLSGVEDCVVVAREHPDLHHAVHAVILLEQGASPMTIEALRAKLSGQLSAYKLPRSVEYVSELPRSDAGKIRRSAYRRSASDLN